MNERDGYRSLWPSKQPQFKPKPQPPAEIKGTTYKRGEVRAFVENTGEADISQLIERIESYPFESEGGDLRACVDWIKLKEALTAAKERG